MSTNQAIARSRRPAVVTMYDRAATAVIADVRCLSWSSNRVPYALDELYATSPTERLVVPYENPHYPVVHIAKWPRTSFGSHGEFVRLTEMYDSAMQGFIQKMTLDELAEWFVPHEDYDLSVPPFDIAVSRTEDAVEWMQRNFPFVRIPWLRSGDHTEIIEEAEGEFGDLIAYGDAGYLYVFVADLL